MAHLVLARHRAGGGVAVEERHQGHQESRGAEAALQTVRLPECLLQWIERAVGRRETLDRRHRAAFRLHGEHQAGADRLAVDEHRARAADTVLATHVGAGELE